ncbi:hypothetical protein [Flavobacterium sp.]|uniref:hypothetical protein n=1 Tax=Flavobacterium sp. TaxID=239 RepID=UPI003752F7C2
MTINILLYGLFKSLKERKNMFPYIIKDIEFKSSIFNSDRVTISSKIDENSLESDKS